MVEEGKIPNRGGVFIDAYNQSINEEIAMTITARVITCNHYYITEIHDGGEEKIPYISETTRLF